MNVEFVHPRIALNRVPRHADLFDPAFFALATDDPGALGIVSHESGARWACLTDSWTQVGFLWGNVDAAESIVTEIRQFLFDRKLPYLLFSLSPKLCDAMRTALRNISRSTWSVLPRVSYDFDPSAYPSSRLACPQLPPGFRLTPLTNQLFEKIVQELDSDFSGSRCRGSAEVQGSVLQTADGTCVAYAWAPVIKGMAEIGVVTASAYRQRGYARIAATAFIDECLRRRWLPRVSTNLSNSPAVRWARAMGFRKPVEHQWLIVRRM